MTRGRILVVEDEAITAMTLESSLRSLGYDVVASVSTGEEAVTTARQEHVDVVLMDIRLRGILDGITAAQKIRDEVNVPCIYLTAYSDEETLRRAKVTTPFGYLVKPYNERELRAAIEIALYNAAMERDRRAAQDAIEARDRVLQDILDNSPAAVFLLDNEGRFTFVNRGFEKLFGIARADVRGKEEDEAIPPPLRGFLGSEAQAEVSIPQPDGTARDHLVSRFPLHDVRGVKYGTCGVMTDVTALKRAQDELVRAQARYRMIERATTDVITITTNEGVVEYVSPACARLLGYAPDEVESTDGRSLLHPDDAERIAGLHAPAPGVPEAPITFRLRRKDGTYVWVEASVQALDADLPFRSEGQILSVVRDVTERVEAEQAMRELQGRLEQRVVERTRELEDLNRRLTAFNERVSHDLRAPMRGIALLADDLGDSYGANLPPDARKLIDRLQGEVARIGGLLSDLLAYARAASEPTRSTTVDLTRLARQIEERLRREEPARAVRIEIEEGLECEGDALLLSLVLENLLGNAWKFTSRRGDARIRFWASLGPGDTRTFHIEDNGVGFEPTQAARLFRPFERLHGSDFPGTGLGLSSVKAIIERHGGNVEADGAPGQGAHFRFTLPARSTPASDGRVPLAAP